ncbi:MAG: hydroxymethylpyrimidine/phosphomethylpyrimidine kinase [Candidatus Promineofilum sp.]|nr:hydroxymethylpyrimidine/phosphomethylpyrimidine kinase [Promineifilum sp.]
MPQPLPLLTIAGSDSGGAAGLQADLKTWAALGVYGLSAITAVTAQNSERVAAVNTLPPDFVAAQIDAVLSDYGAVAIKTGFLGRVEIVEVVAERLTYWRNVDIGRGGSQTRPYIIIDPVLVNHRGEAMFPPAVAAAYRALLFPLADLVTPNRAEARLLRMWDEAQGGGGAGEQGGVELLQSQDSPSGTGLRTHLPCSPAPPPPCLLPARHAFCSKVSNGATRWWTCIGMVNSQSNYPSRASTPSTPTAAATRSRPPSAPSSLWATPGPTPSTAPRRSPTLPSAAARRGAGLGRWKRSEMTAGDE